MGKSFHFNLVNGRFGDPALYVRCVWERRALLFDLGEISRLRPSQILAVTDVFVSHSHIDHFIGFDHLLRVMLNRDRTVRIYGPAGIVDNVAGKLRGYTWNLVDDYRLRLKVHEVTPDRVEAVTFSCRRRFRDRSRRVARGFGGVVLDSERFEVKAALLDHSVPCLGFALREKERLGIDGDAVRRLGWLTGPWLGRLKERLREGRRGARPASLLVPLAGAGAPRTVRVPVARAEGLVVRRERGTKMTYVTDVSFTEPNRRKIVELGAESDIFFCEAAFLQRDADHGARKHHLTALQAGDLARHAGARTLEIFHFSPKYLGEEEDLLAEAESAHRGERAAS